ncbi:MAG TPA: heavy-metal-associated domain-containing protein [Sporosarcina sp.]|nr:heavy-metal-associated domain-containing protein [Sporosarcina sp.]
MAKERFVVEGMTCNGCANKIKQHVECIESANVVNVNIEAGSIEVTFDEARTTSEEVKMAIHHAGYPVIEETVKTKSSCQCCSTK